MFTTQENESSHITKEQYCQRMDTVSHMKCKGKHSIMQTHNDSAFLVILTFACEALIACARQLDIMDEECGDGNYGTMLAHSANAVKIAIEENKILATRPSAAFIQISHIIEKTMGSLKAGIYSSFFDAAAKSFLKFQNDEHITANMWLTALTSANKTISEIGGTSVGDRTMLDALIPAEHKLRDALDSGLSPINAFGEAVKAAEASAMQTVHILSPQCTNSTKHKVFKYPDPGAHAVGIWIRAAYEGTKLKFGCKYM